MMITKTLSALTDPTKGLLEPVHKLNRQAITAIEKVAAYQVDSLTTYSRLGINQLKAAAEVRDVEGLKNLLSKQTDVLREVGDRLMSDFKACFQVGADFVSQSSKVDAEAADVAAVKVA